MGCVTEILNSTNLTSAGDHQAGPRVWRSHANLVSLKIVFRWMTGTGCFMFNSFFPSGNHDVIGSSRCGLGTTVYILFGVTGSFSESVYPKFTGTLPEPQ